MDTTEAHSHHNVEVHVKSLKTNESTHFGIAETATLNEVWNEAVDSGHLDEQHAGDDTFRCADGTDLSGRLETTLEHLAAEGVCHNRHFEIRGASGGA